MGSSTWDNTPAPADNSWKTHSGGGGDGWEADGGAAVGNGGFSEENVSRHAGPDGANDGGCRTCGADGHFARDCPDKPAGSDGCFNCGEEGHMKFECPNPRIGGGGGGACFSCGEEGHNKSECPNKVCEACDEPGHSSADCTGTNRVTKMFKLLGIQDVEVEQAWRQIEDADREKELEDIKMGVYSYAKAFPDLTFQELEKAFRDGGMNVHLIAKEQEIAASYTIVNFQGVKDLKYVVSFQWGPKAKRAKFAEGWPVTSEENMERLAEAGIVMNSFVPKCKRCEEYGHTVSTCEQEKEENAGPRVPITCAVCNQDGHRARDCTEPRKTYGGGCKNCGSEEHRVKDCPEPRTDIECNICNEVGHMSRDCPSKPPDVCRNCGQEGHRKNDCVNERVMKCRNCEQYGHSARECSKPRDMDKVQCRNCDEMGHDSRGCPKPTDWSKVVCSNCKQNGHTYRRCTNEPADAAPAPEADGDAGGGGGGGWEDGGAAANPASGGGGWEENASAAPVASNGGW